MRARAGARAPAAAPADDDDRPSSGRRGERATPRFRRRDAGDARPRAGLGARPRGATHGDLPRREQGVDDRRDTDPVPVERARRGGKWLCSAGQCGLSLGEQGTSSIGNGMLRSIRLQTPGLPLPVSILGAWRAENSASISIPCSSVGATTATSARTGKPIEAVGPDGKPNPNRDKVMPCVDGTPRPPKPDSGELALGLQWPEATEMADFRYLAIVDSCGNARVQPFRRTFTVPVLEVASGGCGKPDGKVLRIFPNGGWVRVTAFNLDAPAAGNVVNATYRVRSPPSRSIRLASTRTVAVPRHREGPRGGLRSAPLARFEERPGDEGAARYGPSAGSGAPWRDAASSARARWPGPDACDRRRRRRRRRQEEAIGPAAPESSLC